MDNVQFIKELSRREYCSTWEAMIDGVHCVVKRIELKSTDAAEIKRNLDAQIKFASVVDDEVGDCRGKIALFTESCEHGNELLYIRAFVEGTSLAEEIKTKGRIETNRAIKIILDTARLISVAHQRGIFHGDLKPENIIISNDDNVCVIDWETMKLNREAQNIYAAGRTLKADELAGSPHYMAPEQFRGEISGRTDVYSLGMILYKMLTGETPFDKYDVCEIYDAKHKELDSTLYHSKQFDADIAQIIDGALKVDCNSRTATIDQFINEIERYLNISTGEENNTDLPLPPPTGDELNIVHKLVLIGHPGAGKTVLAAGLYAMNNDKFSVEGADQETIRFADSVKTILQRHEWPDPTAKSGARQLSFNLFYNRHQDNIVFDEYAGENVSSANYFTNFFSPAPDGAIILLNPSFIEAVDDLTQNKQISALKNCISYLAGLENRPPIAFVVTAADRLETDLKDKVEIFNKYVNEIKNSLKSKKVVFRIFYVSVSGKLNSQREAALNPDNVQKPFIWILKQVRQSRAMTVLKKIARWAGVILVLASLILLGRWGWEWNDNNDLQKRIAKFHAMNSEKKIDDLEYLKKLSGLRKELCLKGHILTEKNTGSRNGECNHSCIKWTRRPIFPDRKRALMQTITGLDEKIDDIKLRILRISYEKVIKLAEEKDLKKVNKSTFDSECGGFEQDFKEWNPLSPHGREEKTKFENSDLKKLPAAKERHRYSVIAKELTEIIDQKKTEIPVHLGGDIQGLPDKSKTKLSTEEWDRQQQRINSLQDSAKQSVERVLFGAVKDRLTAVIDKADCKIYPLDIDDQIKSLPSPSNLSAGERKRLDGEVKELRSKARRSVAMRRADDVKNLLQKTIDAPAAGMPANFDEVYRSWQESMSYFEDAAEAKRVDGEIKEKQSAAYEKVFCFQNDGLRNRITTFSGNVNELSILIGEFNDFFKDNKYHVSGIVFEDKKSETLQSLKIRLEKYVSDLCAIFDSEQMKSKGEVTPRFKGEIEKIIFPIVTPEIKSSLLNSINAALQKTDSNWRAQRRNVINAFIRRNESKDAIDVVEDIKQLVVQDGECENPFLSDAEKFVIQKLRTTTQLFLSTVNSRDFSEDDFLNMKRLAEAANGRSISRFCPTIRNDAILTWLNEYFKWKRENTSFEVSHGKLEVCVSYYKPNDPYINVFYCKANGRTLTSYHSGGWNTTRFKNDVFTEFKDAEAWPPRSVDMKIGQKWKFHAKINDEEEDPDRTIAEVDYEFYPGVDDISSAIEARGDNGVVVRIYVDISGEPFTRWLRNHPFPNVR